MRRRGITLLYVIGAMAVMMIVVSSLIAMASQRYHHAQFSRDRLQALECAQAGLLWARGCLRRGETLGPEPQTLDLGPAGRVRVTAREASEGLHIEAVGITLRDGESQATRRLEVLWP
jgi:type II secretory pathway component PulK